MQNLVHKIVVCNFKEYQRVLISIEWSLRWHLLERWMELYACVGQFRDWISKHKSILPFVDSSFISTSSSKKFFFFFKCNRIFVQDAQWLSIGIEKQQFSLKHAHLSGLTLNKLSPESLILSRNCNTHSKTDSSILWNGIKCSNYYVDNSYLCIFLFPGDTSPIVPISIDVYDISLFTNIRSIRNTGMESSEVI